MTTWVVATAGHVDHGKSSLVRALTGVDPDRLPEEQRRGLTIELGFARLRVGNDEIHLVDVPGHVRFIGTMLMGVGAVDACLFVVAATEGWMAQTEEHLRILELLGVRHGVIAMTMADLVDHAELHAVVDAVRAQTRGSFLESAAVLAVDSVSGRGVEAVPSALHDVVAGTDESREATGRARLWIDRSFSIAGAGTVVTGTLTGGPLAVGDTVRLATRRGQREGRVRRLESFGDGADHLFPGRRAAVNLTGLGHREVHRGDVLVHPGRWHEATTVDVSLSVMANLAHPVRAAGAHILHLGTNEQPVRLQVLRRRSIGPSEAGVARLRLSRPLPLTPGDRFVLRDAGTAATVGGGEILDVEPVLRPSRASPTRDVERVVAERGWVAVDDLERLTGVRAAPTVGSWVVAPAALAAEQEEVRRMVADSGAAGLDVARLDSRQRAVAASDPELEVQQGRVRPTGMTDGLDAHPYLAALVAMPFSPPAPEEAGASSDDVRALLRSGLAMREGDIVFAATAVAAAAEAAATLLERAPDGFSVSDLRAYLGTTRRFALPLLARLDRDGITRRRGDVRIAGPRLPGRNQ